MLESTRMMRNHDQAGALWCFFLSSLNQFGKCRSLQNTRGRRPRPPCKQLQINTISSPTPDDLAESKLNSMNPPSRCPRTITSLSTITYDRRFHNNYPTKPDYRCAVQRKTALTRATPLDSQFLWSG